MHHPWSHAGGSPVSGQIVFLLLLCILHVCPSLTAMALSWRHPVVWYCHHDRCQSVPYIIKQQQALWAVWTDRSMIRRSSIWELHWSTRRSTRLRIGLKSSHARMPCSWPRSTAVTAWASRHITIYLTRQLTPCVQDAVMVHTLWNTGFWSALGPSQQEETSLVKWVRRWRSWWIIQERQCWCLGAPCRAAVSAFQTSVNSNNNKALLRLDWIGLSMV